MADSATARRNILRRIRTAQGRFHAASAAERAGVADYLARHPQGPRPNLDTDLLTRFLLQAKRMSSTAEVVPARNAVVDAVAHYLASHELPLSIVVAGELAALDWSRAGIEVRAGGARDADLTGVGAAFCALAETGTLVFLSSPNSPATVNLLPETHIAVVPEERIFAGMEDAFEAIRVEQGDLPRAVNLVSGPSRTGDIEQTIVLGAHGPYRVHVIVLARA